MPPHGGLRIDAAYADARLAALYDALNAWGPGDDFYLDLVARAPSVLDVGCGTGEILCRARVAGHTGELAGVDPAPAMLAIARSKRADVTWVPGDAASFGTGRAYDLAVMTGHAFQVLLTDDDVVAALRNVRRHLVPGGRLAFETRNPAARAWERWTPEHSRTTVRGPGGEAYEVWHQVVGMPGPGLVDFETTFRTASWSVTTPSRLRFVEPGHLTALLRAEGFAVEAVYGGWDRSALGPASPEVVVTAVAAGGGSPHHVLRQPSP